MASTQVTGWRGMGADRTVTADSVRSLARHVLPGLRRMGAACVTARTGLALLSGGALIGSITHAGTASALDVVLAASLVSHLAMAGGPYRRAFTWGIGQAGLVFCVAGAFGVLAWPAALWLLSFAVASWRASARGPAVLSLAAAGSAFGLLASADYLLAGDAVDLVAGRLAVAYLIATSVMPSWSLGPVPVGSLDSSGRALAAAGYAAAVLDRTGDLVTCHDAQGDVLDALGEAGATRLGLRANALRGQGLFDSVHIPDRPAYLRALSDAVNGASPVSAFVRLRAGPAAGDAYDLSVPETRWVEMCVTAIAADPAAAWPADAAMLVVIRDAADARRSAEAIDAARLASTQASEAKSQFLASVTHELRTPLNAIIGFAELLSGEHPYVLAEERRREYAAIIRDSGHHLLDVVNTLLDVTKIESGQFAFAPEPFDLAALARGCCELLRLRAEQAGISLVARIADGLSDAAADRRACRQILINLISNAVKFSAPGGRVTLDVRREGDRIVLAVGDDGVGIRESDLPRLGDPFFQAGDRRGRPADGTGLGLSVVRGLVGLHRGTMAIESGTGLGTTVTVELPGQGVQVGPAVHDGPALGPVVMRTTVRRPAPTFERKSA